jgi:hypothetical protein
MSYPKKLTLKALESTHSEYQTLEPVWKKIDDLTNGGHQLAVNKENYVKKRPGEKDNVYNQRLDRFTYNNVIGQALNDQTSKLSLGTISVDWDNKSPLVDQFWSEFLINIDNQNSNSFEFLSELFRTLLRFKYCYLHVDRTTPSTPIETKADLETTDSKTYVNMIEPQLVLNWDLDDFNNLNWIKFRTISHKSNPLTGENYVIAQWVFIDRFEVAKYQAIVEIKDGKIKITAEDADRNQDGDAFVSLLEDYPKFHNFEQIPVVRAEIPDYLWVLNQAYLLAIEHLNLHNARYDTAMTSGYVQRTVKPKQEDKISDQDLDLTYINFRQNQKKNDDDARMASDNSHILLVDEFKFNEATGQPVIMLMSVLETLEIRIKQTIGTTAYQGSKSEIEQPGIRRRIDLAVQEIFLRRFGEILIETFNKILPLVAETRGFITAIATGLNKFNLDDLADLADLAVLIEPIQSNLAPTALKLFYSELQKQLAKNATEENNVAIAKETEQIWRSFNPNENPDNTL